MELGATSQPKVTLHIQARISRSRSKDGGGALGCWQGSSGTLRSSQQGGKRHFGEGGIFV